MQSNFLLIARTFINAPFFPRKGQTILLQDLFNKTAISRNLLKLKKLLFLLYTVQCFRMSWTVIYFYEILPLGVVMLVQYLLQYVDIFVALSKWQ